MPPPLDDSSVAVGAVAGVFVGVAVGATVAVGCGGVGDAVGVYIGVAVVSAVTVGVCVCAVLGVGVAVAAGLPSSAQMGFMVALPAVALLAMRSISWSPGYAGV